MPNEAPKKPLEPSAAEPTRITENAEDEPLDAVAGGVRLPTGGPIKVDPDVCISKLQ